MRPQKFGPALELCAEPATDTDWLRHATSIGLAHERLPRLVRAERSPSGNAHCRHCHELVNRGEWRLALQLFEEGRMQPIGTIHAECAKPYFGTREILDRIERLTRTLSSEELDEVRQRIERS